MSENPIGIDFGGTGIKAAAVDLGVGDFASDREKIQTPRPATPAAVSEVFVELVGRFPASTSPVGVTVPGVVRHGVVHSAANIDPSWIGADADAIFTEALGREVHVVNDADAAGLAEVEFGCGEGPARPGHRHHARHRDRLGADPRRDPGPQLRAQGTSRSTATTPSPGRPTRRARTRSSPTPSGPSGSRPTTAPSSGSSRPS
ncbi:ROK family protein [Nocardioides sp. B-3]|uniref:ROK family protein n=1 Tax=Nocardioides sp. B-3 TaxID=2895565 RepID=UPI00300DD199